MKSAQKVDPGEEQFPLAPAGTRTSELKFEERQTDRLTDRQTNRQTDRDRQRQRERSTFRVMC